MFLKIKSRVNLELQSYIASIDKTYHLNNLSPLLFKSIKEFISRDGKRVRPVLFCIGYLGFAKKPASGLYRSAISLELLHDFMLVHDDIIDKSNTRRGLPSMHALLDNYLRKYKKIKFNGADLTIVAGDVMYAMALDAFLAVKESPGRKELALRKLISAALFTGSGEFIELLLGAKPIAEVNKEEIYKIYDYKTANYTFSSPLTMGAILAGANKNQIKKLFDYGIYLGRAFQIKDDIIGIFSSESEIGKSNLTDLLEEKKTLLLWYAYNNSCPKDKAIIKKILSAKSIRLEDLSRMQSIIKSSGALDYAKKEITSLMQKSQRLIDNLPMRGIYKKTLVEFCRKILAINY
ncbi:MAG: polyprenyl synthetase family protein [Candidatus Omnitrophica bacterium]|jgi:geranylgeranyl diphosphate synthase type I|nr:polyprenyl synthetase family protein [Candidatus Omnitrophota bacterium]